MKYYTIKSVSDEGEYYLVNGWYKYKTFWVDKNHLIPEMLFKREADAKRSLTKLLKLMPEYEDDTFLIEEIDIEVKEIYIEISGGNLQSVWSNCGDANVILIDLDNAMYDDDYEKKCKESFRKVTNNKEFKMLF